MQNRQVHRDRKLISGCLGLEKVLGAEQWRELLKGVCHITGSGICHFSGGLLLQFSDSRFIERSHGRAFTSPYSGVSLIGFNPSGPLSV